MIFGVLLSVLKGCINEVIDEFCKHGFPPCWWHVKVDSSPVSSKHCPSLKLLRVVISSVTQVLTITDLSPGLAVNTSPFEHVEVSSVFVIQLSVCSSVLYYDRMIIWCVLN